MISRTSDIKVRVVASREIQKAIAIIISRMKKEKKSRIRIDAVAIYIDTNQFGLWEDNNFRREETYRQAQKRVHVWTLIEGQ